VIFVARAEFIGSGINVFISAVMAIDPCNPPSLRGHGIVGTLQKVSAKYLPLCVAEFEFRYDKRNNTDIFRTAVARC
jgi:hypothetical protein